jgi:DNA primase
MRNGGWLHIPAGSAPNPPPPRPAPRPEIRIDAEAIWKRWRMATPLAMIYDFAPTLGLGTVALTAIGAAWAPEHRAWAFPMRDASSRVVGIRLRNAAGQKWAVKGSHQGIFIPGAPAQDAVLVCEGPTDTAAALGLGYYALGRPSCNGGAEQIACFCRAKGVRRAVVVADNDDPGVQGAHRIASELGLPACVILPPAGKDIREFCRLGGTRQLLDAQIENSIWTPPSPSRFILHMQ